MTMEGASANPAGPIAVDGASGYVGNHVVATLRKKGIEVHCIVHPGIRDIDRQFLSSTGAKIFETNLDENSTVLQDALKGVACVIHLIGSIAPPKGQKLSDLHAGQTTQLVAACHKAATKKILMVTALGTSADAESQYHQTKWQAEEVVRNSGIDFVILRPSLIIGRTVGHRQSKLVARYMKLIEEKDQIPVIEGAKNLIQPIFIGDLAEMIATAATGSKFNKQTIEIGGARVMQMHEFISALMDVMSRKKPLRPVPAGLANLGAFFLEMFSPGVPLLSRDQVKLACTDNICKNNAAVDLLGREPSDLSTALQGYAAMQKEMAAGNA